MLTQLFVVQPTPPTPPTPPEPPLPPFPPDAPVPPFPQDFPFEVIPSLPTSLVIVSCAFFAMIVLIAVGIPIARAFARRMDRQGVEPARNPEILARLDRIEHAVESVAIEVERISEAQRYTAKLFNERLQEPLPLRSGKEG